MEVPVNHEWLMANTACDAELVPDRFCAVVMAGHNMSAGRLGRIDESCPLGQRTLPTQGSAVSGTLVSIAPDFTLPYQFCFAWSWSQISAQSAQKTLPSRSG